MRAGAEVWLVGGYVRDLALGHTVKDVDLVSGQGTSRLVSALRSAWDQRGFRFRKRGVTTWRFRIGGRDVDLVDGARRGVRQDLLRRELTVNAIAFDLVAARLLDPTGGLRDLRARRLRMPRAGVMVEDPVRALRLARFCAQFPDFSMARATEVEARSVVRSLRRASVERIRDELDRLLLAAAPARGLELLEELRLLPAVLPELVPARSCTAGGGRPDVWHHTLDALADASRVRRLPGSVATRDRESRLVLHWALLLHDVAKPETLAFGPGGRPTFHGHEVLGARKADAILARLRQPRDRRRRVRRLVLHHLRPHHLSDDGAPPRGMRRLVREAQDDLPLLLVHAACDARASGAPDAVRRWRRLRSVLVELDALFARSRLRPRAPLLTGRDVMRVLGIHPGPEVGSWLARVRDRQDDGQVDTREQALEWLAGQVCPPVDGERAGGGRQASPRGTGKESSDG